MTPAKKLKNMFKGRSFAFIMTSGLPEAFLWNKIRVSIYRDKQGMLCITIMKLLVICRLMKF
ncbi:hypothetical protein TUM12370_19140 [Salmonella enterica subsp. enterica serovar Choleraesuis]|nr:hypothetical protein TUM12370_19140 [Salmonella enterica subsp. enterica serovar Choleraesuis]